MNRALAAKHAKAKRQRMGVDAIAPRFSDKAGQFRPTEATKPYNLEPKPHPVNVTDCGVKPRRLPTEEPHQRIARGHGDPARRGSILTPDVYYTGGSWLIPAR